MVFWGSLGLVLGALGLLGSSFGAFAGSRWHPEFSKLLFWSPLNPHLGPRGASNSPKRLPRRPHGEANGPTKPPRLIRKRIWTDFLMIWGPKSILKKKSRDIVTVPSKRLSALGFSPNILAVSSQQSAVGSWQLAVSSQQSAASS